MAVIESRYRSNMTLAQGIQIVQEAIQSGIENDMGSGSQVDLCIITTTEQDDQRPVELLVNHTRAAVPEPQLSQVEMKQLVGESGSSTKSGASTPGVNGFGSVPFSVRSKRLVIKSLAASLTEPDEWEALLGSSREP